MPTIGFRPRGTRVLRETAETTTDSTKLVVLAAAAASSGTDVVVEWERTGDPATCPPGSLLAHSNRAPLENGLSAALVVGTTTLNAIAMMRHGYQLSHSFIGAIDAMTFPPLPDAARPAELRISEGARTWRVPLDLVPGPTNARTLASEAARHGIVIRATALSRYEEELIVELEVQAPHQIRQVGAPLPTTMRFSNTSEEDLVARRAEMRRVFSERSRPISLEDDRGNRVEEVRRVIPPGPQQTIAEQLFVSRFLVVFDAPSSEARSATLAVPFVELNDFGPSVIADLRQVPLDLELDGHQLRLVAVEPYGADQRKIVIEILPSIAVPRFVQPARLRGSDAEFGWERHDAVIPGRDAIWMATKVGDPPVVTFTGVVLRVDGPLRLEVPLA